MRVFPPETPSNVELGLFRGDPDKGHTGWMCSARARGHYVVTARAHLDPLEAVQGALLKLVELLAQRV